MYLKTKIALAKKSAFAASGLFVHVILQLLLKMLSNLFFSVIIKHLTRLYIEKNTSSNQNTFMFSDFTFQMSSNVTSSPSK